MQHIGASGNLVFIDRATGKECRITAVTNWHLIAEEIIPGFAAISINIGGNIGESEYYKLREALSSDLPLTVELSG